MSFLGVRYIPKVVLLVLLWLSIIPHLKLTLKFLIHFPQRPRSGPACSAGRAGIGSASESATWPERAHSDPFFASKYDKWRKVTRCSSIKTTWSAQNFKPNLYKKLGVGAALLKNMVKTIVPSVALRKKNNHKGLSENRVYSQWNSHFS